MLKFGGVCLWLINQPPAKGPRQKQEFNKALAREPNG